jgi:hypothetical protein
VTASRGVTWPKNGSLGAGDLHRASDCSSTGASNLGSTKQMLCPELAGRFGRIVCPARRHDSKRDRILAAKKMADRLGGVDKARELLAALAQLV